MAKTSKRGRRGVEVDVDEKNGRLIIDMPLDVEGIESGSGKSIIHASTRGNRTYGDANVQGMPLTIAVNAYTENPDFNGK